ncbi:MAG: hypothetical protein ACJ8KX_07940 [Chthoniobacterales bacterium]
MTRFSLLIASLIVLPLGACSKAKKYEVVTEEQKGEQAGPKIDACSLLTSEEIQSVQGEAVQETKPSSSSGKGFYAAQCYFSLPTHTNSVVVTVTQRAAAATGKGPREWWAETFHREEGEREPERGRGREREEEERKNPPTKIDGVGDEAFWTGNAVGGALYVLKDDVYIRVSTGGKGQLDRAKRLAELAVKHL